ncbi:MAG: CHAD domain-containing protein [Burkholderiales bacterium]|nr:CHAD domain-containing protein [Burkholderiales bacterium]
MHTETELKLLLAPRYWARVMRHPAIEAAAAAPASSARLLSVYYDTPRFDLWSAGISVRLRRTDAGWVQTIKSGGSVTGGLHTREELEQPVPEQALDLDAVTPETLARRFASARLRRRLKPIFSTDFERTTRMLALPAGGSVELSLDRGHIVAGKARAPICELELELKHGDPVHLYDLALALMQGMSVRPGYASKAERGYRLAGLERTPAKARRVALEPTIGIAQSASRIIASGLEQVQANEHGMLAGEDIEYLHQMRVGVRRLRSCVSVYGHVGSGATVDMLKAELKWLGRRLGPARDWDVFTVESLPQLAFGLREVADAAALEALRRGAQRERDTGQAAACRAVRSRRYARLLLLLGRIAAGAALVQGKDVDAPAAAFTAALLERRMQRVLERVGRRKPRGVAQMHALRIAVKKLRYAVEFFGPLYDSPRVQPFRERLVRIQDCLGEVNDAWGVPALVRQASPRSRRLADQVAGWSAHRIHDQSRRFRQAWRQFRRSRKFW